MITSIFSKTRPLNYVILSVFLLIAFCCYFICNNLFSQGWESLGYFLLYFSITLASVGFLNFIVLKNNLTKGNNYTELLFICFLLFFPGILKSESILIANFFLLLAFRRSLSLRSKVAIKEKLFDASFWIFIAALFHFWAVLYIVLVFVSIALYFSRDYKNWLIPFIAFIVVATLASMFNLWFDNKILDHLLNQIGISFNFFCFDSEYQHVALAIYTALALLFFTAMLFLLRFKPLNLQATFKQVIAAFILAGVIYALSINKNNTMLLFSIVPASIMGANYIQQIKVKAVKEIFLIIIFLLSVFFFINAL